MFFNLNRFQFASLYKRVALWIVNFFFEYLVPNHKMITKCVGRVALLGRDALWLCGASLLPRLLLELSRNSVFGNVLPARALKKPNLTRDEHNRRSTHPYTVPCNRNSILRSGSQAPPVCPIRRTNKTRTGRCRRPRGSGPATGRCASGLPVHASNTFFYVCFNRVL